MNQHPFGVSENPILRMPYEEPATHFELDAAGRNTHVVLPGRRPSETATGIPGGDGVILDPETVEPHKTINILRHTVKKWRGDGYPGTTTNTRRLLEFWQSTDPGAAGLRPFWCQMEAIETIIWLFEAGRVHDPDLHQKITHKLAVVNHRYNDDMPRAAFKMATGTGKTNVMAMAMLWMLVNHAHQDDGGTTNFLVMAPNLTVKKRLQVLNPKTGTDLWNAITPRGFRWAINRAEVTIANFHAFQRRITTPGGKPLGKEEKAMLGKSSVKNFEESDADMVRRVLRGHHKDAKIIVINDEAHHCYKPAQTARREKDEDVDYQKAAALWFNALKILKEQDRLVQVYDFSATPMWLATPRGLDSEIFPWTVSDFPLLDAIESGLVKIPRVPVQDDTESYQPKYRNIYEYNGGKDLTKSLPIRVQEPLRQLYRHYHDTVNPAYEKVGVVPVFIIVVNKIKNAVALYRWLAGSYDRKSHSGMHGNLDLFSNYGLDGSPKERPPTLLVHSRLFDKVQPVGQEKEMVEEQSMLFGLDGSLADKQEKIRDLFTSIGAGDAGHIRCVISVGMLTEGWDAKNVTHIFGYRRFGSLLLCEQVTGRALRRTSFVGSGTQKPEYANVFGVPYTFARGGEADPQPPAQPYDIFSVPERDRFRISFPNVVGYQNPKVQRRFRLNRAKVKPYMVEPEPTETTVLGSGGERIVTTRDRRAQTAIWETAKLVSTLLNRDFREDAGLHIMAGRRTSFMDSLRIVKEWLAHPKVVCRDVAGMIADPDVPQQVVNACEHDDDALGLRPIFADENMEGERFSTTEGIMFKTTLQHTYREVSWDSTTLDGSGGDDFLAKSELNRAACHSRQEAQVAHILDTHPLIDAWARNFRLDFRIRWFNEAEGAWRDTEPDFVARVKTGDGRELHLVIEFKGMKKGEAEENAKRYYIENWWCPAVSGYGKYGVWKSVWIEDGASARRMISEACT